MAHDLQIIINIALFLACFGGLLWLAGWLTHKHVLPGADAAMESELRELGVDMQSRIKDVDGNRARREASVRDLGDQVSVPRKRVRDLWEAASGASRRAEAALDEGQSQGAAITAAAMVRGRLEAAWPARGARLWHAAAMNALTAYEAEAEAGRAEEDQRLHALEAGLSLARQAVETASNTPLAPMPLAQASVGAVAEAVAPEVAAEDTRSAVHQRLAERQRKFREVQQLQEQTVALLDWARQVLLPEVDRLLDAETPPPGLREALEAAGVVELQAEPGDKSDGRNHEEIAQGTMAGYSPGQIIRRVARGYEWQGIVLRKAQVVVAAQA